MTLKWLKQVRLGNQKFYIRLISFEMQLKGGNIPKTIQNICIFWKLHFSVECLLVFCSWSFPASPIVNAWELQTVYLGKKNQDITLSKIKKSPWTPMYWETVKYGYKKKSVLDKKITCNHNEIAFSINLFSSAFMSSITKTDCSLWKGSYVWVPNKIIIIFFFSWGWERQSAKPIFILIYTILKALSLKL